MARQWGVTEEILEKVNHYEAANELSGKEKAALRFVDAFYRDHRQIPESLWNGLREHFSEEEIVELAWYVAFTAAYGKLIHAFQIPREDEI